MQWLLVFILVKVCFCVLWALILEETLDGRGLLRNGSWKYRWVLEFIFISFSLFGVFKYFCFQHRSISTILCYLMPTLCPLWIGQKGADSVYSGPTRPLFYGHYLSETLKCSEVMHLFLFRESLTLPSTGLSSFWRSRVKFSAEQNKFSEASINIIN